jgi:dTDP-4-amino-4,6-dideoxygalactose transaminase
MNLASESKVVMPGYTCMVVPSAVQHAGLKAIYLDIDPKTYNLNPAALEHLSDTDIAAILVQHTYGIPASMAAIEAWATPRGIPIIEDCCHAFGTRIQGRLCGTFGAFAFMSGQWNKPFSTGLGGILLVNDMRLADQVNRIIREEANIVGPLKNLLLQAQIFAFDRLVNPASSAMVTGVYRGLNRLGLVIGSSSRKELRGGMPNRYLTTMAPCQACRGLHEMANIQENIRHRVNIALLYHRELPRIGFVPLSFPLEEGLPLLRYPVRVANKSEVVAMAKKHAVDIGSWFDAPLHPYGTRMEDFGYRLGMCPEAEIASRQVINLPTGLLVDESTAAKSLQFLRQHARPIPD